MPALSLAILKALREEGRLTITRLTSIHGANRNTLKPRRRGMVKDGRVRRVYRAGSMTTVGISGSMKAEAPIGAMHGIARPKARAIRANLG